MAVCQANIKDDLIVENAYRHCILAAPGFTEFINFLMETGKWEVYTDFVQADFV